MRLSYKRQPNEVVTLVGNSLRLNVAVLVQTDAGKKALAGVAKIRQRTLGGTS